MTTHSDTAKTTKLWISPEMEAANDAAKAKTTLWRMDTTVASDSIEVSVLEKSRIAIEQGPDQIIFAADEALQLCHNIMAAAELAKEQDSE